MEGHHRLVASLQEPQRYPWPVDAVERVETHISSVLLAGEYVLKLKKPLNLGFLDFSTLEQRAHYCAEEVRINARLAPRIYLRTLTVGGTPEEPVVDAEGAVLEHAVLMRRFPDNALMSDRLERGELPEEAVDELARQLAVFHEGLEPAPADSPNGTLADIAGPARANFEQMDTLAVTEPWRPVLSDLRSWTESELRRLEPVFEDRRSSGRIRECHGDLHLGNVAWDGNEVLIFDGIEFDPALRWIDTANEVAFTVMDLDFRAAPRLRHRFLARYLEACGDYGLLRVLGFYTVYRALVRTKINALEAEGGVHAERAREDLERHLELARGYTEAQRPTLFITHGLSGSGKSTVAWRYVEETGAVRVRSDVERKRLAGLPADRSAASAPGGGIYDSDMSERTYARLEEAAEAALQGGWPVVVDAAFLEQGRRQRFLELAQREGVPFVILDLRVDTETLKERLRRRARKGADPSDADEGVLAMQLETREPLTEAEESYARVVGAE